MRPMSQPSGLSDLQERVLLAVWKLRGVGKNGVDDSKLGSELENETAENLAAAVEELRNQGFLEATNQQNQSLLSLTPLGLAILRKVEEDRLQELK